MRDAKGQAAPRGGAFAALMRLFAAICVLALASPAGAESLTPMRGGSLPALQASSEPLVGIAMIEGRPVAIQRDAAWALDKDKTAWSPLPWRNFADSAIVIGLFGDEARTYALTGAPGSQAVTGVAQVVIAHGQLGLQALPSLPIALEQAHGAIKDNQIYVAGLDGMAAQLLRAELDAVNPQWTRLPGWPGVDRPTSLMAQTGAVFITVSGAQGGRESLLRWSADQGWTRVGQVPGTVVPNSPRPIGQAHAIYLVREPGTEAAAVPMTFQTITRAWATLPGVTVPEPVAVAPWHDGFLWAQASRGGPVRFGYAQIESTKLLLKWLDWIVIALYLISMLGIGLYFYLREKRNSTANFFVGGRSIPFWAAGVSLYATNTSSISFIAIPAKAFETNWQYLTNNLIAILGLMFVAVWIVPLLRRLDLMSVFSYLETRFHPAVRMIASALCIVMQIGSRMSIILFLPSLAIATITGIDVVWSILIMGVFTILYTTLGGMKAVIWTDFVQVFVMFGGAFFAIAFIIYSINGGIPEFLAAANADHKFKLLDFSFDLTQATVWGFIFLVLFDVVLTFPKDQVLMQRVLSTKSDKEAGRSVWAFAAIMIPGGFFFYMIGTALYVYYQSHPERMNPTLPIDATFPLFIAAELPAGITGLIIAGIFAAAMSTLSSIINSVSTLASVDFYEKLAKNPTPKKSVLFAELIGIAVGLVGIGIALLLSRFDIHSLFDVSIELAGLLGGGFAGAYTLGMFTRRANSPGVAIGIGSSICLTMLAWSFDLVHPYFYLAISILLCIVIGYLASLMFPAPKRSLAGLTIYADRASDSNRDHLPAPEKAD
ncbi:sodium/solute symporter [Luteimonas sp. SX5]|uniref:Sodium/solute symporter n=1 Tax=Luteimonas galliterrae TaxID=2940486 RepID=A0ABT0MJR6_9GAMM|nr:sodium:solute symporter [Luteimonas galliterrae]MCL1635106.1 sodium/solute symporter [Luteimonas galliterrae]